MNKMITLIHSVPENRPFPEDLYNFVQNQRENAVLVMGRRSFYALPKHTRPENVIVITHNPRAYKGPVKHMTLETFEKTAGNYLLLMSSLSRCFVQKADRVYVVQHAEAKPVKHADLVPDKAYLYGYTKTPHYNLLLYKATSEPPQEALYNSLIADIITKGQLRPTRTRSPAYSLFNQMLTFDVSDGKIPLMTSKYTSFNSIVQELLFFLRGNTDTKLLLDKSVRIWEHNTNKNALEALNLNYREHVMGPMYGWSWRHFNAEYSQTLADTTHVNRKAIGGFDQIEHVINLLKTDPFSKRIYITNMNPSVAKDCVLHPCHTSVHFYVTREQGTMYLSCTFYMRSSDALAFSYNVSSYTILLNILAKKANLEPKEIVYHAVDAHVYLENLAATKVQIARSFKPAPRLYLNPDIARKPIECISQDDIELIGYFSNPSIKMSCAN